MFTQSIASVCPNLQTFTIYSAYYIYICLASITVPGKKVKGHPKPKRPPQLNYYINGFRILIITLTLILLFGGIVPTLKNLTIFKISTLCTLFYPLLSTVFLWSLVVSILLYLKAIYKISILGESVDQHSHNSFFLDFWVGRELNPRIGSFDLKFSAYRVSMIFWLVLNLAFLAQHIENTQTINTRMLIYQFMTSFYVLDYFWNEEKMLTTWDVINQQFGFMLVFGDYLFTSFVFSIQCHYLINYPDFEYMFMGPLILFIFVVGYCLFRLSNSQKNQFKTNSQALIWGKPPQTIDDKLLISGFWGVSRHMNYTGDLLMALAFCLPCGLQLGGYSYAIYLLLLLVHRAERDDRKCSQKYSSFWIQYTQRVKYVFVPFKPIDDLFHSLGRFEYWLTKGQKLKIN